MEDRGTFVSHCMVEVEDEGAQGWVQGAMVRDGPQEGPTEQGPEGQCGKGK